MKKYFLFLFVLFFCSSILKAESFELTSKWFFFNSQNSNVYPAKIPGSIYGDLFRNKLIVDPYLGENEKTLKWVEDIEWTYVDTFFLNEKQLLKRRIELQINGVDTYASVYLNNKLVGDLSNMFVSYSFDVKNISRKINILKIVIHSTPEITDSLSKLYSYQFPGGKRAVTRKAAFQFGWDFAPDLKAGGIWKPIQIELTDDISNVNFQINTIKIYDSLAIMKLHVEFDSEIAETFKLKIKNTDIGIDLVNSVHVEKGINNFSFQFQIAKPELWKVNGSGFSKLYEMICDILNNSENKFHGIIKFGIRKVELERKSDLSGESFQFVVNGESIFMKGANVVPPDYFVGETTDSSWQRIVQKAASLNMNMLRVWGGGVYPPESFFNECDRMGILVWQDFMFACNMYPGNELFISSVKTEAIQQVKRISSHPSLALWCGNNENIEGWNNWGWQKQFKYSQADSLQLINDYIKIFEKELPAIVHSNSELVSYWPSSPSIGWGRKESMSKGDSHYWGVWWGMEPFSVYQEKIPRFMSEYGFQSLPSMASIQKFVGGGVLDLNSRGLKNHQKHPVGFETIVNYMNEEYGASTNLRQFSYLSQLLQRDALKTAIVAHRMAEPYTMGSLFWQMNDCWPSISWSVIDYYGREKAATYEVQKLFNTTFMTVDVDSSNLISIRIVTDSSHTVEAVLQIKLIDFDGNVKWSDNKKVKLVSHHSLIAYRKQFSTFMNSVDTTSTFLLVDLMMDDEVKCRSVVYFCKAKNLKLKRPAISMRRNELGENKYSLELSSNIFAKDVELSVKNDATGFSANYFDMLPNEKYVITYTSKEGLTPMDGFSIHSLVDN